ncbi:MAG: malate synthase G [Dehalococcoidia bacterium]|nr:malate synthase G [Dehalococcoidia bacterium]
MTTLTLASGTSVEIDGELYEFVRDEVVPDTGKTVDEVFSILGDLVEQFGPENQELLDKRTSRQAKIDGYYQAKRKSGWEPTADSAAADAVALGQFLVDEGHLEPESAVYVGMTTPELDFEMSQNGPELVTPVNIASMAVGGANARWGSLYDAYFLSDINSEIDRDSSRAERLQMVVDRTNEYLDSHVAQWENGVGFNDLVAYSVSKDSDGKYSLRGQTKDGAEAGLQDSAKFVGFNLEGNQLSEFFLEDNGMKLQFQLYEGGKVDAENGQFKDLIVESAVTNIVDFEDAVAIVDAEDMVLALRNYLGLIRGDLQAHSSRGALKAINPDLSYIGVDGSSQTAKGTSLMSVRNVSLHMYTDMVKVGGEEISERMLGVLLTTLIATSHDKGSDGRGPNSRKGYVYQVTPKLQTAEEVGEQVRLFEAVEDRLGLAKNTMLIGIMNEELGMTLQLAEALRVAQSRIFFTNTGFLDRTGSQIRVQTQAGPVDLRDDLTGSVFNTSYELHNVDVSLRAGVHRQGKIGKGMQVRNRAMVDMMENKINHPKSGGNTAWVPAPNPSHLHSMHYHMIDVDQVQRIMEDSPSPNISRRDLLTFPVLESGKVADQQTKETLLLSYAHSMVAYVEPWVHRGIGCSGVPNFSQIEEMKDRATERIDGAIIANWRLHGVVSQTEIEDAIKKATEILDQQNLGQPGYEPMTDTPEKVAGLLQEPAISAVLQIIDDALSSPSAYVESALFRYRKAVKAASNQ